MDRFEKLWYMSYPDRSADRSFTVPEELSSLATLWYAVRSDLHKVEKQCQRSKKHNKDAKALRVIADDWAEKVYLPLLKTTATEIARDENGYRARLNEVVRRARELRDFVQAFKSECRAKQRR